MKGMRVLTVTRVRWRGTARPCAKGRGCTDRLRVWEESSRLGLSMFVLGQGETAYYCSPPRSRKGKSGYLEDALK